MTHTNCKMFMRLFISGIAVTLIVGCAPAVKQNAALDRARQTYADVSAIPDIDKLAPVEMRDAEKSLDEAEEAKTDEEITRKAYLSQKKAELAKANAERKLAEANMEMLTRDNQKLILESRQQEIDKGKKEVEAQSREAEKMRIEAAEKDREIVRTRSEAESSRLKTEQAEEETRKLENELAELKAKKTDEGLVLTLGDVFFKTAKSDLMAGAMRSIDKLSVFLNKYPNRNVMIEGHTDSAGDESYNMNLSERRAESVRMALTSRGVDGGRITTRGYGESFPIAGNENEAGRQQNRRVQIIILNEGVSTNSVKR